jgi:hypothetical protein
MGSPAPLLILLAGVAGGALLWRAGVWTPASVRRFRRLAASNGFAGRGPVGERIARRAPLLTHLQEALNVRRLLRVAGRGEEPSVWLLCVLSLSLLATAGMFALDALSWAVNGRLALPPFVCVLFGALCVALGYVRLRNAALRRRARLGAAISQAYTELAMLTYTRQLSVQAALEDVVAPCQEDGHLHRLLGDERWRSLVEVEQVGLPEFERHMLMSRTAIYDAIASSIGVPAFHVLATNLRRINDKGQTPADVLTGLASMVADSELAEMLVRSEQSRARQALPVGLMVLPLLLLIGYPLLVGLAGVFG